MLAIAKKNVLYQSLWLWLWFIYIQQKFFCPHSDSTIWRRKEKCYGDNEKSQPVHEKYYQIRSKMLPSQKQWDTIKDTYSSSKGKLVKVKRIEIHILEALFLVLFENKQNINSRILQLLNLHNNPGYIRLCVYWCIYVCRPYLV